MVALKRRDGRRCAKLVPIYWGGVSTSGEPKSTDRNESRVSSRVNGHASRKRAASVDAVLRQVIAQRALTDSHHLCGLFLHPSGLLQRPPDCFAFDPFQVLMKSH